MDSITGLSPFSNRVVSLCLHSEKTLMVVHKYSLMSQWTVLSFSSLLDDGRCQSEGFLIFFH